MDTNNANMETGNASNPCRARQMLGLYALRRKIGQDY
jgi:hypothetical protein